jgi:hypothetical protein
MEVLIAESLEINVIQQLSRLAQCDNICDFEKTLRFINNSVYITYREIPQYILENEPLRKCFSDKYIELLELYSDLL